MSSVAQQVRELDDGGPLGLAVDCLEAHFRRCHDAGVVTDRLELPVVAHEQHLDAEGQEVLDEPRREHRGLVDHDQVGGDGRDTHEHHFQVPSALALRTALRISRKTAGLTRDLR